MAKALFHKNQRVYVKPVGTWALVERVVPHWVKGIDEPIRIHYDLGLGREFSADELRHGIHGGAMETSIMLARFPQHVKRDAIADFPSSAAAMEKEFRWLSTQRPAPFAWQAQDLNASGAVGDARQATAEKGGQLLDHGARAFCDLLCDVDNFAVKRLAAGPRGTPK